MKEFNRFNKENLPLYNDIAYKVLDVESTVDVGLYEEKTFKNGNARRMKSKTVLKQRITLHFSGK